jgi:uncharacterized protein YbbC (DUF1343 family)
MKYIVKVSFFYLVFIFLFCSFGHGAQADKSVTIKPGAYSTGEYFKLLRNKNIGVVANFGSLIDHTNLIDTLLASKIKVVRIFSPEHGFNVKADAGAKVEDQNYENTNIPVISIYGKSKKPSSAELADIDIMVFDLQDIGVRFYTYISTLHYVMEACSEEAKPLVILDRPNPNGFYIDGPTLDPNYSSFIGMHPVPVVYGLTIGEYAHMINGEKWLKNKMKCRLKVIKCKNYTHQSFYDLTVDPSPNLKDMKAIYLYPSMAFFEGTVVSEGRGTDAPFLIAGHPDYSDRNFSFKPEPRSGASMDPKFNGIVCYGIDLRNTPFEKLQLTSHLDLNYLIRFYNDLKLGDKFFIPFFDKLAGTDKLRMMIIGGKSEYEIRESWQDDLTKYKKIRVKYLLYPDFE